MSKRCFILLWLSVLALSGGGAFTSSSYGEEPAFTEYEVKAAFMYNMMKFIDWPEGSGAVSRDSLNICILGTDPFGKALDDIKGKTVKGRRVEVRRARSQGDLKECHMAFISSSEKDQVPRIVDSLKDAAVVTVGDTEGYASQGIMINFFMEGKNVRFEINPERARRAKVSINSHLLKLSRRTAEREP